MPGAIDFIKKIMFLYIYSLIKKLLLPTLGPYVTENVTLHFSLHALWSQWFPTVLLEPSHLLTIEIVEHLLIITILEVLVKPAN